MSDSGGGENMEVEEEEEELSPELVWTSIDPTDKAVEAERNTLSRLVSKGKITSKEAEQAQTRTLELKAGGVKWGSKWHYEDEVYAVMVVTTKRSGEGSIDDPAVFRLVKFPGVTQRWQVKMRAGDIFVADCNEYTMTSKYSYHLAPTFEKATLVRWPCDRKKPTKVGRLPGYGEQQKKETRRRASIVTGSDPKGRRRGSMMSSATEAYLARAEVSAAARRDKLAGRSSQATVEEE